MLVRWAVSCIWYFFNHLSHLFHENSLNFVKIFILFAIYMYTISSPQLLVSQTHTKTEHQFRALHSTAQNEEGLMASLIPSQGYARGVLWFIRMLEPCLWAAAAILLAWPRTGCRSELTNKLLALCTASSDRQVSTEGRMRSAEASKVSDANILEVNLNAYYARGKLKTLWHQEFMKVSCLDTFQICDKK